VDLLVAIITLALLAGVVLVISGPLRAARRRDRDTGAAGDAAPGSPERGLELERDELEAAREAKYREIRDAELDYRTGKLSSEDYEAIDSTLRAEAIAILKRLDSLSASAER
jgi:hypothetical protein